MASTHCADSALGVVKLMEDSIGFKSSSLLVLKVDLRFLTTFLSCATKWSSFDNAHKIEQDEVSLASFLLRVEDVVHQNVQVMESLLLRLDDGMIPQSLSKFHQTVQSFSQQINGFYRDYLLGCSSEFRAPTRDGLVKLLDSVLDNIRDVRSYDMRELSEDLEEKVGFLKNMISFAVMRGVEDEQLEDLMFHAEVVVMNLAHLYYEYSYVGVDGMNLKASELLQKIKPVETQVREAYTHVLKVSESSGSFKCMSLNQTLGDFIDSVRGNLWEIIICSGSEFLDSVKDHLQLLYDGLSFLRSILSDQDKKFNDLHEKTRNLIGDVVCEAGIISCSLFAKEKEDGLAKAITLSISDLMKKIKYIKSETAEKYPVTTRFNYPRTDVLGNGSQKNEFGEGKSNKTSGHVQSQVNTPIINDIVVGFDDEAEALNNLLTRGTSDLDIVSIIGMPGLGKTTLAKKLYNDPSVVYHFHIRAWSCVSQQYHRNRLLLDILEGIFTELPPRFSEMNEDDLFEQLYKSLKGKRYLTILDDVWDVCVWNDFGRLFPNDSNGSRILLTTRLHDVALHANSKLHFLRQLTENECCDLLRKKLFIEEEDNSPGLSQLMMQIAKICKGLPFSIVVVAGTLAAMAKDGWAEVVERLSSTTLYGTEQCISTLELSYTHLPNYLKPCLLYLGLFPRDQQVSVSKLMWLWIAEGFVPKSDLKSLEDIAENYMMDLRGRSLIMVGEQSSLGGRIKTCHIHDLVHEFCMAKAKEEHFVELLRGSGELSMFYEPPHGGVGRLCIHSEPEPLRRSRLFAPHIHSLVFFNMDKNWHARDPSNVSFLFHLCKLLRVLNLEKANVGDIFPSEIQLLVQLRFLALCGDMYFIPSSISRLGNLETLVIEGFSHDVLLPDTIWNMKKLRHLHINKSVILSLPNDPLANSVLCNLDTLSTASFGLETGNMMQFLPNVRRLKCRLSESWNSGGLLELDFLTRLESLRIFNHSGMQHNFRFVFPENLKKLTLSEFWLPWSEMSAIGRLPNLEVLKLLTGAFEGETWDIQEEGSFPKLQFLKLEFLGLVSWTASCDEFLPRIKKLVFKNCSNLEEIPPNVGDIPTLTMIEVYRCQESLASLVMQIQEEQLDLGNEVLKILIHASVRTVED